MSQSSAAMPGNPEQDEIRNLESKIEQLLLENRKLLEESAALEARAVLVSQHEDQRLIDSARFRAILANNRSGILLLAPNGTIVEMVHSIFGHEKNQAVGLNAADVMQPESALRFRNNLDYVVQTPGSEHQGEYCLSNAAGEERWLELILSDQLSQPAIQAIVCNSRDITERKLAEAKHALAGSIVQSSDCAILSFDFDGKILSWNPGAAELYGYSLEEMTGENLSVLSLPGHYDADSSVRQLVREGKSVPWFCSGLRHKDGSTVEVRLKLGPLRNENGELAGCSHIASRV